MFVCTFHGNSLNFILIKIVFFFNLVTSLTLRKQNISVKQMLECQPVDERYANVFDQMTVRKDMNLGKYFTDLITFYYLRILQITLSRT